MYNDFIWRLEGCVNGHAPITKLNRKEKKNKKQKPWITNEILKKINKRTKLFAGKKNNPENETLKKIYNLFRNSMKRDIKVS